MRKDITLPVLALVGGAAGFLLRRWQMASAYAPEAGLFTRGAPATYALMGLIVLLAAGFLLLLWKKPEGLDDFLPAFGCPGTGQMAVLAAAGLLMLFAGGFGMQDGFRALRLWRADPGTYQLSVPGAQLLAGGLCAIAGLAVIYMGRMAYRGELDRTACLFSPVPALAALVWLFATHLEHGTEPVLMKYAPTLFAVLLFTLAHYYAAGFLFGKPRPRLTLFCALMGTVVGVTALSDAVGQRDVFTMAAVAAFSLSCLGFAHALLGGPWPERMPPSEEDVS